MDEDKVLFVPRWAHKGYNCSIELQSDGRQGCRVFLRPAPGKGFLVEEDLSILLGMPDPKPLPLWLAAEGVEIERANVPEDEVQISFRGKVLSFKDTVKFLSTLKTLKIA